jgi:hypothetical protein
MEEMLHSFGHLRAAELPFFIVFASTSRSPWIARHLQPTHDIMGTRQWGCRRYFYGQK